MLESILCAEARLLGAGLALPKDFLGGRDSVLSVKGEDMSGSFVAFSGEGVRDRLQYPGEISTNLLRLGPRPQLLRDQSKPVVP